MKTSVSIITPVWNEQGNLELLIQRIDASMKKAGMSYELIAIDDHSTDQSLRILKKLSKLYPIRFALKQGERGKARSLLEGFELARYDIIAMIDADLQYPPEAIPEMAAKIGKTGDIIVARRIAKDISFKRRVVGNACRYLTGTLLHGLSCDVQSGLKVFRHEIIRQVDISPTSGWAFDLEFLLKAGDLGYSIANHDIVFEKRYSGTTKVNILEGSLGVGMTALRLKFRRTKLRRLLPV